MDKVLNNARVICDKVLDIKKNEKILIIANPRADLLKIARALAKAAKEKGAKPAKFNAEQRKHLDGDYILVQPKKTSKDFMEEYVRDAIIAKPEIVISIPADKLGKDRVGLEKPYKKGKIVRDSLLMFLLDTKQLRGFWTPHITLDTWERTIDIDYDLLRSRVKKLIKLFKDADVHITTKKGTDLRMSLKGRQPLPDNGDISKKGGSGNMPCGEVFLGPKIGSMQGTWILDGMIPLHSGKILFLEKDPLTIKWEKGYIKSVKGKQAAKLLESIKWAEKEAKTKFKGKKAEKYFKNARHCGELGIGLNPNAKIVGTVLEDEKIMGTFHLAIGMNYEGDAPAFIHLDGVTHDPTIEVIKDGKTKVIMRDGELLF